MHSEFESEQTNINYILHMNISLSSTANPSMETSNSDNIVKKITELNLPIIADILQSKLKISSKKNFLQNISAPSDIFVIGALKTMKQFAVFGCAVSFQKYPPDMNYVFYLPLTVLAWQRISFGSIVILSGNFAAWTEDPIFAFVIKTLLGLNAIIIFIPSLDDNAVMLSQVSRLFVSSLLAPEFELSYLVTSDSDLWPLDGESFILPKNKKILSLNSDCCDPFYHRGEQVKMIPLSSIGMSVSMWRDVMNTTAHSIFNANDIIEYLRDEFGDFVKQPVVKGENSGWYLDQHLISIRLAQWVKTHDKELIHYVPRSVGHDRVDRSWWSISYSSQTRKIDAHILENGHRSENWRRLLPLLSWMYEDEKQFQWCQDYHKAFLNLVRTEGYN